MKSIRQHHQLQIISSSQQPIPQANGIGANLTKTHLALHTGIGIQLIAINDIVRVASDSNYCTIHCRNGSQLLASKTLLHVERLLSTIYFTRIHRSHLVRLTEIHLIQKDEIVLKNGDRLPIARHKRNTVIEKLEGFSSRI